jgi:hypothetical protein
MLRDVGMALALLGSPTWSEAARVAIDHLAASGRRFTSDDLVALVGLPRPSEPNRNNAVGAVLSGAARRGVIRRTGDHNATRPLSHARRLTVWEGTTNAMERAPEHVLEVAVARAIHLVRTGGTRADVERALSVGIAAAHRLDSRLDKATP